MNDLLILFKPGLQGFRNRFGRRAGGGAKRPIVMGGLGLILCSGLFLLSCRVLIHFQSVEVIGDVLAHYLLGMVLLTFFSLLIFSHIIAAISNLYLSRDLEFCHSLPVDLEELFISRAVRTFVDSSWMLVVFGFPVFLAYAYVYRPGPLFYIALVHANVAMAVIAAGTGILVTMILVRFFPARRTRDILVLLSMVMIVFLYLMFRFLRPERLVNPEAFFSVMQYVDALRAPQSPYLPTQWITEILWGSLTGKSGNDGYLFETLLAWSTACALCVLNIAVAGKLYFEGFSRSREARKRIPGGRKMLDWAVKQLSRPFEGDSAGLIKKDIRVFFRDNTQWSQLLLLGALVVVYVYNFTVLPLDKAPIRIDFLQNQLAFFNMGLAGFVLSAVSARFVFTAISSEGEAYWLIRSSPLSIRRYIKTKFFFFLVPMLLLGECLILLTNYLLEVTTFMMVLSSLTMFLMVMGIVGLGIGFGASYPSFRHQNVAQLATGFGGVLYMIVSSIFVVVIIILEAGPVYILFISGIKDTAVSSLQWLFVALSFMAVFAAVAAATIISLKRGFRALRRYEM